MLTLTQTSWCIRVQLVISARSHDLPGSSPKGPDLPITARGNGTDTTGAAIGKGIILSTTAHMGRILELDTKQRMVRVQPGLNLKSLQETLHTHGLFLPSYPANYKYSTIGGAIANNAAGEKSQKYGSLRKWVDRLEVVLANGEVIQTGKINKKSLKNARVCRRSRVRYIGRSTASPTTTFRRSTNIMLIDLTSWLVIMSVTICWIVLPKTVRVI